MMSPTQPKEPPIRAVIIDDQAAIRQALSALLDAEPDMEVVGRAGDGEEGLKVVFQTQPDVVLLDLEMPRMDGFAFLRLLMTKRPTAVVVVSSHSTRESVFKALELGALEFVAKPVRAHGAPDFYMVKDDLLSKIRLSRRLQVVSLTDRARLSTAQAAQQASLPNQGPARPPQRFPLMLSPPLTQPGSGPGPGPASPPASPLQRPPREQADTLPERLLCIGASTGGPTSILTLLRSLDANLPVGILITQHMPEKFTKAFAERLERTTRWTVREAASREVITAGLVLVAPGGWSLRVVREGGSLRVQPPLEGESRNDGFVPSVDRMMESAAQAMGQQVIAAILTGMAGDGVKGALAVRAAGGKVLAEAPESAVIASMPEEAIRSGAVDAVVPLRKMAEVITRLILKRDVTG